MPLRGGAAAALARCVGSRCTIVTRALAIGHHDQPLARMDDVHRLQIELLDQAALVDGADLSETSPQSPVMWSAKIAHRAALGRQDRRSSRRDHDLAQLELRVC